MTISKTPVRLYTDDELRTILIDAVGEKLGNKLADFNELKEHHRVAADKYFNAPDGLSDSEYHELYTQFVKVDNELRKFRLY
jgi:hypothetical protein